MLSSHLVLTVVTNATYGLNCELWLPSGAMSVTGNNTQPFKNANAFSRDDTWKLWGHNSRCEMSELLPLPPPSPTHLKCRCYNYKL